MADIWSHFVSSQNEPKSIGIHPESLIANLGIIYTPKKQTNTLGHQEQTSKRLIFVHGLPYPWIIQQQTDLRVATQMPGNYPKRRFSTTFSDLNPSRQQHLLIFTFPTDVSHPMAHSQRDAAFFHQGKEIFWTWL